MRRLAVVACVLGTLSGVNASAAPPAPQPSASATTYLPTGAALPASTVSAAWSRVRPGCGGSLRASGAVVSGTTTVVTGGFLSRAFRPRHGEVLSVGFDQGGRRLAEPFPERFALAFRIRGVGRPWSPWMTLSLTSVAAPVPSPLLSVSYGGASIDVFQVPRPGRRPALQQVQVRLRDEITATGAADDEFQAHAGC